MKQPYFLVVAGPTASGKTHVARAIRQRVPAQIVSCDSMQVYRSMPILTQGSDDADLSGFLDPSERYSADAYRKDAGASIRAILKENKLPLVVGGTGLYLRALLSGLFESAGKDSGSEAIREKLLSEETVSGPGTLHRRLVSVDPASAEKIHAHDTRRLVRALEVYELTGRPLSEQKQNRSGLRSEFQFKLFVLDLPREYLYERIHQRVDLMVRQGLIEEVRTLLAMNLSVTARSALGIKEIRQYLEGRLSLEKALDLLKQNTRNYAKRQLSWFRHEEGAEFVSVAVGQSADSLADEILRRSRELLD